MNTPSVRAVSRHGLMSAALHYFALVFAAGFVLGVLRVTLVVPRLGERLAELGEMPIMVLASALAARRVLARSDAAGTLARRLALGGLALALLVGAEYLVATGLRGLTPAEYLSGRDPVSGAAYALALLLFAFMPAMVGGRSRQSM